MGAGVSRNIFLELALSSCFLSRHTSLLSLTLPCHRWCAGAHSVYSFPIICLHGLMGGPVPIVLHAIHWKPAPEAGRFISYGHFFWYSSLWYLCASQPFMAPSSFIPTKVSWGNVFPLSERSTDYRAAILETLSELTDIIYPNLQVPGITPHL